MNMELGIKLQAHLDGELTGREAQEITALIDKDAEIGALFAELKQTKGWLKANQPEFRLPESREFYWSKIERDILRLESSAQVESTPAWLAFLHRHVRSLAGAAATAALVLFVGLQMNWLSPGMFEEIENPLEENGAFSFRSESQNLTLVWISEPSVASQEAPEEPVENLQ